ncbi:MAG TPA: transporter substrate-binding domain-containing protein [Chitinophagaceae bacterium]|nr:transporter substrate-binding domain-containing protein [Chitinophagaceae bacterium]
MACQQEGKKTQLSTTDSSGSSADTTHISFNADNEFLGLGVPQFGDLDSMISRRRIRALVAYNHLYYYIDGKERRGVAFEVLNRFEHSLNEQLKLKTNGVKIIFIPVNRSQVIPLLRNGYGDLAYAGMTVTEERKKIVDFSTPTITGLKEIVVGGPASPKLNSLADLAGKEIYLHAGTNYEAIVKRLSDSLKRSGLHPIIIKPVDPYLESEDILEMVSAGVIPYTAIVEDIAALWSNVIDSLTLYNQIPLATNISYAWVIRKNSPKLKAAADQFLEKNAKGTMMGNMMYNKYVKSTNLLPDMHSKKTIAQVKALRSTFQNYSTRFKLDWLLCVAQGYQESGLNQDKVSHMGAVGIMQVLPPTAAGKPINISNVDITDNNIHAGVKYMRFLIDKYFNDPDIDILNRHLLALAAYNAGPARVAQLRKIAKEKGLNPNLWFDNVEIIAAQEIGRETVQYVSNIYKFYASYRALNYYALQRGRKLVQ